ncbi:MAG TPA: LysM peptidoglycan-binding domain-containing protein, partial [Spirochaetia bacterium]|nr:LysM peptidoglycan-binding domain-containing protein [Spirochaetia bacterium]
LLYLPIAESSYDPYAVSKVGAAGLWQLMSATGHSHDLRIDQWVDQRFDFRKATDASLELLKEDKAALGNWLLALAAYDAGLGFMESVIAKTGIHDYWKLAADGYLPAETANYVPRFLALVAICSYPGRYGLPLSWVKPVQWARIRLAQPVDIRLLADEAKVNGSLLLEGNAGLRHPVTPPGGIAYSLNVPSSDTQAVKRALNEPQSNLMRFYIYPVKRGDTLYKLAQYYGVPVSMILRYNPGVTPRSLAGGTLLLIPAVKNVTPYKSAPADPPKPVPPQLAARFSATYTVRKGDTLWSISRRFHATPSELAQVNALENEGLIRIGMVLHVPPG